MKTFNSYKDVKICCYAMCASEPEAFIDRWLESMKGADWITVLVTKANDPNYAYFKQKQQLPEFANKLIVEEKAISPWRFDTARNESMKLIPKEADALICTDIDEILIEDFWDDYRKCVFEHPNFERIYYQYAWSHDETTGDPKWYFWYDKTHQNGGWFWDYPVHESLKCPEIESYGYTGTYYLDSNKIYLHHYPDTTKSRSSYLGLLEMRAKEYPEDMYGLYYLQREYSFIDDYESALKTAVQLYVRLLKNNPNAEELEARDDMMMLSGTCVSIGDYFLQFNMKEDAELFYKKAMAHDPGFRDSYIKLAQMYAYCGRYSDCYLILDLMDIKSVYRVDWRLVSYYWRDWKRYQILADAKCWEGDLKEAGRYFNLALADIKTDDDRKDASEEGFYNDYQWYLINKGKA